MRDKISIKKIIHSLIALVIIIIICCLAFLVLKLNQKPKNLEEYLKELGYKKDEFDCYTKKVLNSVPEEEEVHFCFKECKYYSYFSTEKIAIDFTNSNAVYKNSPLINLSFKIDNPDSGVCDLVAPDRGLEKGTDDFENYCKLSKLRAKQRIETFKNIIKEYSVKDCKPTGFSNMDDFAKGYPK